MVCESVQLLNCSLENVFKGISCRGIRDGWEIFLKLENKNVKFQFLPWSLYVFHQEFGGLVKEAGSGLKRRKDCKTTNVYPRGMGWLFTLTSKWLLLQPGVLNQSCMLWSGWVPKLIFGKLELGLSRHVGVSSGTRITFCPTGVLFYQSSVGAGDQIRHFAAHMSSDRDFLVRSLSWYFTRCCLAFIKLRSVFIYLFISLWYFPSTGRFLSDLPHCSAADSVFQGLRHAERCTQSRRAPPPPCSAACWALLGSEQEGAAGTPVAGVSCPSLCRPVVWTKGSHNKIFFFQGFVGPSSQKGDYLVLIFNSCPQFWWE